MRHKIIAVTAGAMLLLLIAVFANINIYMEQLALEQIDGFLHNALEHDGIIKDFEIEGRPNEAGPIVRGTSMLISPEGEMLNIIHNDLSISEETLDEVAQKLELRKVSTGSIDDYRYGMKATRDGYIVVIADTSVQNVMLEKLVLLSYIIGAISFSVIFILIIFLSRYITKPVEISFEKQKRFISDSSHELKTPLSVISANLELLEMEIGDNSRINAISLSIKRMNNLVHDLLVLARTEQKSKDFITFNLSKVMESTILPLEVIAYEDGKQIEMQVDDNVIFIGDEEGIRKMIGALIENAIKYSKKNSVIRATLHVKGDYKIIEFFNEGIGVTKEQKERLFDKFYRVDDSRQSETGGHGIGLSIVKNVVDMHRGKISVESIPNEYIVFRITLRG
jgi:signal transduction histidine kinase